MWRKVLVSLALACGGLMVDVQPALAQQTFNISLGYFQVRGEDARVDGDVLNANRNFLTFDVNEMSGATAGAEWLVPMALSRGSAAWAYARPSASTRSSSTMT